jgi:2,4-dienoyl-CoA reductase-like NADH-dependent reductase (Old Yellow Enzyme family)
MQSIGTHVWDLLFSHIKIGSMVLPNRFVRSATNEYLTDKDDFVTDRLSELYERLARGGVGLIITGYAYVRKDGKSSPKQAAIYHDRFIPAYKNLLERLNPYPSKIVLQIAHGGRQSRPELCGGTPIGPSPVTDKSTGITPREMTEEDILDVIGCFGVAARRAKEAGFHGVQLHAAHGYLLNQFISPNTNRRRDRWGGSIENRARMLLEVLKECRRQVGKRYPVLVKLSSDDCLKGGLREEEAVEIAKLLDKEGIDAIEVSGGESRLSVARTDIDSPKKEAYFSHNAWKIKKSVSVPVICVGGIRSLEIMEGIIREGKADMVSMSRPFIREPDLVDKFRKGLITQAACISCNQCFHPKGIRCAQLAKDAP